MSHHFYVRTVHGYTLKPLKLNFTGTGKFYLSAARLHLHAFYLFDEPAAFGYADRILTLYQTARSLIQQGLELDDQDPGFFHFCPFFCYQVFISASFILLKTLMNGYFASLLDVTEGKKLVDAAISAARKMSAANNDLPGRLSDVLAFFCTLPDPRVISGERIDGLQLTVRNRLTMSIVYDGLWQWRRHFQHGARKQADIPSTQDK